MGNCGRAESLPQTSVRAHTACKGIKDVNLFFEYIFIIVIKFDQNVYVSKNKLYIRIEVFILFEDKFLNFHNKYGKAFYYICYSFIYSTWWLFLYQNIMYCFMSSSIMIWNKDYFFQVGAVHANAGIANQPYKY